MYTIEFNQSFKHLLSLQWFHTRKSKVARNTRILFLLLFIVIWSVLFRSISSVIACVIIWIILFYFISPFFLPLQTLIILKSGKNKQWTGPIHYEFNEEYILEKNNAGESKYLWESIDHIGENKKYIFIFLTSLTALIIPKIHFTNNIELNKFRIFISSKITIKGT